MFVSSTKNNIANAHSYPSTITPPSSIENSLVGIEVPRAQWSASMFVVIYVSFISVIALTTISMFFLFYYEYYCTYCYFRGTWFI